MIHKTTRSILSVLLAALLLVTSTPLTPAFADGGAVSLQSESGESEGLKQDGDGTYLIYTAENLKEFAVIVNGTDSIPADSDADARLMNDINLSSVCGPALDDRSPVSWTPIGNSSNEYSGTFNGDGHTISGLYINSSSANYQGLFGYVSGTVQNLSVSGTVRGRMYVGGVVGHNRGTVENCCNIGTVTGTYDYVGGVVGYNSSSGTVENCYNTGNISGNRYVGGVVGWNDSGSVENCYNTGTVTGGAGVGGVVGGNDSGTVKNCYNTGDVSRVSVGESVGGVVGLNRGSSSTVENCYNTGAVSHSGYVGGVVGDNEGTVKNCYNTGNINGSSWYVGGVVGENSGSVENCYNTGEVSGNNHVGGVVGWNSGTVENCYNTGSVKGSGNWSSGSWVGGVVGQNSGNVTNCYNTGSVSSNTSDVGGVVGRNFGNVTGCYFLKGTATSGIGNKEDAEGATAVKDLNALCDALKGDTWTISENLSRPVLTSNHEDDGSEQHPYEIFTADQLETFRDIVNGTNGNPAAWAVLMENIDLEGSETNPWYPIGNEEHLYTGTFDGNGKTISNLYVTGSDMAGLFAAVDTSGRVENLNVEGSVSGDNAGGVAAANNYEGTIENCTFSGSVSGRLVGGIVGNNLGSVSGCTNNATVTGTEDGSHVGGVVGYNNFEDNNYGSVENCTNTGTVTGTGDYVGGVVGYNYRGPVENCTNNATVTGTENDSDVGGIVGINIDGSVTNCYNIGDVSGNISGGVVGYNDGDSVTNCYYLQQNGVPAQGIGGGSGTSSNVEARTNDAFHSGEVAYLLQKGQPAESGQVWGQTLGGEEDSLPTLVALDNSAQPVYKVTVVYGDYADAPETETSYTNNPATPSETPSREGYTFGGWDQTAEEGNTITYTAKWTPHTYSITASPSALNFGSITVGGAQPAAQNVTITNSGNQQVTVTLPTANDFIITAGTGFTDGSAAIKPGETATFTVQPKAGLSVGTYSETIEVTGTEGAAVTIPASFTVKSRPSYNPPTVSEETTDAIADAQPGETVTVDLSSGSTKLDKDVFETLAGKDVTLVIDLGDDVSWTVKGSDVPEDADFTDIDMGVTMNSDGIPVDVVNAITGERDSVQMTLAHDGDFGFTMTLTAPLGVENAGYWANLYHYDEDADQLTFEAAAKIDEDGSVTIPFSHASQYAIVIDTHSHAAVDVSDLFIDIARDAWYKDAVQYAYDNGLMTGVSATEFAPEATTTRAMIVSILARLENVTTAEAAGFTDVTDEWYATAVNWAANVGVVNGYEDNTFKPNTAITREQLAAILMNYAAYKGEDVSNRADLTSYTDQPSTWAEEAMQWAVAEGLISGVTADTLQPQGAATRAQVAAILQRFLSE